MYVAATRGRLEAEAGLEPMRSPEQRNVNIISWQRQSERKILGTRGRRPGHVATGSMQKHPIDRLIQRRAQAGDARTKQHQ